MPLYEWHCRVCDLTFEALVAASVSKRRRACPLCRRPSARVISAARFHSGKAAPPLDARPAGAKSDVTQLKVPSAARICWMDDRSASRLAAYKQGRGAEYDDTMAAREAVKKKYGVAGKPSSHAHGHSLLTDPAVVARRAAAARKSAGKPQPAP
jgi:putative FmdB family regulatory protein